MVSGAVNLAPGRGRMPETRSSFWLMRAAASSVELTLPELMAINWWPWSEKYRSTSSSALLMMPTVVMAYSPRWERTSRGWGSVSLMQPMPLQPVKFGQILFELGAEGGVFDVVDLALEAVLLVVDRHAAPAWCPGGSGSRCRRTCPARSPAWRHRARKPPMPTSMSIVGLIRPSGGA